MTLIIWDGTTLVSDRRVTVSNRRTEELRYNDAVKIQDGLDGLQWRKDEQLQIIGFTGNVHHYDMVLDFLKRVSPEEKNVFHLFKDYLSDQMHLPFFGMLFITNKAAYRFTHKAQTLSRKPCGVWEHLVHDKRKKEIMVIGAGEDYVDRLNRIFDGTLTARELLFLGTMGHPHLGGGFDKWERANPKILKGNSLTKRQREQLAKKYTTLILEHSIDH